MLTGFSTEEFIRTVNVDIAFLGCDSVDLVSGNIYNSSFMEVGVKKQMIKNGKAVYLVADHAKFARKSLARVASLSEFNGIITDSDLDETSKELAAEYNITLIVA